MSFRGFKTKAAFMSFVRSGLRRMWSRQYLPKRVFIASARRRVPLGRNGAMIWGGVCEHCNKPHKAANMEVDHIKQNHKLTEIEDISNYCDSLFCELSNMRYLCKPCHKIITYAERNNMTFGEAKAEKQAIAFGKLPVEKQNKMLQQWDILDDKITNAKHRRRAATLHYLKEQ